MGFSIQEAIFAISIGIGIVFVIGLYIARNSDKQENKRLYNRLRDLFGKEFDGMVFLSRPDNTTTPSLFVRGSKERGKTDQLERNLKEKYRQNIKTVELLEVSALIDYLCDHAQEIIRGGYVVQLTRKTYLNASVLEFMLQDSIYYLHIRDIIFEHD